MNEQTNSDAQAVSAAAAALGRRAKGHAKRLTAGERARRRAVMERLNAARAALRTAATDGNGGEKAREGGKDDAK